MALSDHVNLTITQDSAGVARAGFGVPMILSCKAVADSFAERIRFYSSIAEVAADFAVTTSPEYLAAAALFAQSPKPKKIAIGRAVGQPTQKYTITVTAVASSDYEITVKGEGVTTTTVKYTSDASPLDNEITAGLKTALDAVVGKNYTVTDNMDGTLTVTGAAAADWFSLEVLKHSLLAIQQDHAEPATTLATDLAAISVENDGWYMLYTLYNSVAYVAAAAAYIETVKKTYIPDVNDTDAINVAEATGTDVLDDIDENNYARTAGAWHPSPADMFGARWMGRCLPEDPGSITWAYKQLKGIAAPTLTTSQRTKISDRSASYLKEEAGKSFAWDGKTGDGNYLDVIRGLDWLEDDMSKSVFEIFLGAKKVPYTDEGVAQLQGAIDASLRRAVNQGIITDDYVIEVPAVADISAGNKALRLLPDMKFSATLAGAIHSANINGTVSL